MRIFAIDGCTGIFSKCKTMDEIIHFMQVPGWQTDRKRRPCPSIADDLFILTENSRKLRATYLWKARGVNRAFTGWTATGTFCSPIINSCHYLDTLN